MTGVVRRLIAGGGPAGGLALFLIVAGMEGLKASSISRALIVVGLTQVLPGALVWRSIRPVEGWWLEDIVVGFAIGSCIAVAAQTVAGLLHLTFLSWAPSVGVTLGLLAIPGARARAFVAQTGRLPVWWGPTVAALSLVLLLPTVHFFRRQPVMWAEGFRQFATDNHFHLALAGQLAHRGPTEIPWVIGEPLTYHWFSHAWIAQISTAGGVPLDEVLFRFAPALLAVVLTSAVAIAAVRMLNRPWAGPLAALVAVGSGDLDLFGGVPAFNRGLLSTPASLSLGFSNVLVVALAILLMVRWRSLARPGAFVLVIVLAFGAAGAKGSALPVVTAGIALALVLAIARRLRSRRIVASDLGAVVFCLATSYVLIFGADGRVRVDPAAALSEGWASSYILRGVEHPGTALMGLAGLMVLLSVLARSGTLFGGLTVPRLRRDPLVAVFAGATLAGVGAVLLLSVGGRSQYWFLRNALPLIAVGSAVGTVVLWDGLKSHRKPIFLLGIAAGSASAALVELGFQRITEPRQQLVSTALVRLTLFVAVVAVVALVAVWIYRRSGVERVLAAVVGTALVSSSVILTSSAQFGEPLSAGRPPAEPTDRFAFSRDQVEAARWLRDRSGPEEVVMTNRHCASPVGEGCDARRFMVAAYTERAVLLEGWAYTLSWRKSTPVGNDPRKPFWDRELQRLNDSFIRAPDGEAASDLYERGVRWIFIDKTALYSEDLDDHATSRYETDWAWVLSLDRP